MHVPAYRPGLHSDFYSFKRTRTRQDSGAFVEKKAVPCSTGMLIEKLGERGSEFVEGDRFLENSQSGIIELFHPFPEPWVMQ